MARVTFNGNPGEVFTNDTDRVLYQFIVNWRNSCGTCAQLDHAIGPYWPIPYHRNCRCQQRPVLPGRSADPYVDYREEIRQLDPHQQAVVVGRSNWALIEKGVVDWEDVVTPTRVRDLREVVSIHKLTVEDMTEAGVGRRIATEAYQSVNTPEHRLIERKQRELVASLRARGLSTRQIKTAVGQQVARRVGVTSAARPVAALSPAVADRLGIAKAPKSAGGKAAKAAPAAPKTQAASTPFTQSAEKVAAFRAKLAAYTEGDRKVQAIREIGTKYTELATIVDGRKADLEAVTAKLKGTKGAARKAIEGEIAAAADVLRTAQGDLRAIEGRTRHFVMQTIAATDPLALDTAGHGTLPEFARNSAETALGFFGRLIEKKGTGSVAFTFASIPAGEEQREYYDRGKVNATSTTTPDVHVHEMGHMLEEMVPGWNAAAQAFLRHRVGDEPLTQLRGLKLPGTAYTADEWSRKDKFDQAFGEKLGWYIGKDYGFQASEVTAMGVQKLFTDPVGFVNRDPEYAKFILGVLDGSLR